LLDWKPVGHYDEGGGIEFPFLGFWTHERRDLLTAFPRP
jgi:hypothetical protein